jgi:hypothetical protein
MGRLFWSFDRAMKSDCLAIVMAHQGQIEFLRMIFGKAEDDGQGAAPATKPNVSSRKLTPGLFDALFGRKKKGR